ncbi:MAG: RnfH family protein [Gammaproteobacteria bacterium]
MAQLHYIQIEVVFQQAVIPLRIVKGTSVREVIQQSGILLGENNKVGIWGKQITFSTPVIQEGSRIEIYEPLLIDPKQARLKRAAQ